MPRPIRICCRPELSRQASITSSATRTDLACNSAIRSGSASEAPRTRTSAPSVTAGTALGGWRIIRTVGRRIYRIQPVDGLASQTASAAVLLGASLTGAPASTTQVVASSVVGVGVGRRRWRHVHWAVVGHMSLAWVVTLPATAALAVVAGGAAVQAVATGTGMA